MTLYYVIGKDHNPYVHCEIKDAYDNKISTQDWMQTHPQDAQMMTNIILALTFPSNGNFPLCMASGYATRFYPIGGVVQTVLDALKSIGVELIENKALATTLYCTSNLPKRSTALDVYYGCEEDDGFINMAFQFKKYFDNHSDTWHEANDPKCFDYDATLGCSKEYKDFCLTLESIGACEACEGVYELPTNMELEAILEHLKAHGYNMIHNAKLC